jgi:hypothetical protein
MSGARTHDLPIMSSATGNGVSCFTRCRSYQREITWMYYKAVFGNDCTGLFLCYVIWNIQSHIDKKAIIRVSWFVSMLDFCHCTVVHVCWGFIRLPYCCCTVVFYGFVRLLLLHCGLVCGMTCYFLQVIKVDQSDFCRLCVCDVWSSVLRTSQYNMAETRAQIFYPHSQISGQCHLPNICHFAYWYVPLIWYFGVWWHECLPIYNELNMQWNFFKPASTWTNRNGHFRWVVGFVRLPLQRNDWQGLKKNYWSTFREGWFSEELVLRSFSVHVCLWKWKV